VDVELHHLLFSALSSSVRLSPQSLGRSSTQPTEYFDGEPSEQGHDHGGAEDEPVERQAAAVIVVAARGAVPVQPFMARRRPAMPAELAPQILEGLGQPWAVGTDVQDFIVVYAARDKRKDDAKKGRTTKI
jgi:hypothetical protein